MSKPVALIAAAVAVLGLAATWLATTLLAPQGDARFAECRGGAVAGGNIGGPFTLVSEAGETVTDADVFTAPTLLYFGYTYCPDICPMDSARNALALDILEEETGIVANAAMITIDPARDTPEVIGAFTHNFHDRMIGLTGTDAQIATAAGAYRVLYSKQGDDPEFYDMNHTTFSYIVLPEVGFVDFIRREDTAEQVAERLACFARAMG
jgi:protein SCO1/2